MRIHIVRSGEISKDKYWEIMELLHQFQGPMEFVTVEKPMNFDKESLTDIEMEEDTFYHKERFLSSCIMAPDVFSLKQVTWDDIFNKCENYRRKYHVHDNDFVILLTFYTNELNWFAADDPGGRNNIFVHTEGWDYFVDGDQKYPIAYEIATAVIRKLMFSNYQELHVGFHEKPRGCMNDFCQDKRQVTFKLRTADICHDCQKIIVDRQIDVLLVRQVFNIIEGIRSQMLFKERFRSTLTPSRLTVKGYERKILLKDLNDLEIKLTPLEKAIYLFFINHPEGIRFVDIPDHRNEIYHIYAEITSASNLAEMNNRIDNLINNTDDSLSQKIARIRSKFIHLLGPDLAEQYYIKGGVSEKRKIILDRGMVEVED